MDYKTKLRNCRSCAEAQPVLETLKVRPSQRKLIETAIQLNQSNDPRQQSHGEDFFITAFREMDDEEEKKHQEQIKHQANIGNVGDDIDSVDKKVHEADEITGELDSHQSSDIDMPYPKEGTDAPSSDIEGSNTASGEDQMKEGLGGMPTPPQQPMQMNAMGGMPPQPGMPPIAPDVMQSMQPKMPPMPQMNSGQMMRQMQYTYDVNTKVFFNRYVKPLIRETKKLREAYVALDKKMQETQSAAGTMKLDIDKVREHSIVRNHVRETIDNQFGNIPMPPPLKFSRVELDENREKIRELDKVIEKRTPGIQ